MDYRELLNTPVGSEDTHHPADAPQDSLDSTKQAISIDDYIEDLKYRLREAQAIKTRNANPKAAAMWERKADKESFENAVFTKAILPYIKKYGIISVSFVDKGHAVEVKATLRMTEDQKAVLGRTKMKQIKTDVHGGNKASKVKKLNTLTKKEEQKNDKQKTGQKTNDQRESTADIPSVL